MSGCRRYSVDLLGHLARHCPSLRSLVVRDCVRICEPEIVQELFDLPPRHRLNLEHLDLQGVLFAQDATTASSDFGSDLARAVQRLVADRLVTLRLGWAGEASGGNALLRSDLRELLQLVGSCGATLRLLDLAGCSPSTSGDLALAKCLRHLTSLRVLCASNYVGMVIGAGLQNCPTTQLVHLNLRGVRTVLDNNLAPLLAANPRLRSLNVGCCDYLTDDTLQVVARHCRELQSLDVCYVARMTCPGIRAVWSALPHLTEFGFSGFAGLQDADIAQLVARLPGLRMIGIGGIPLLTDAALRSLAAGCPSLETLYAAHLPNVTHAGLEALLSGCTRLRRISMAQCGLLPPADVALLRDKYPYTFDGDMLPYDVVRVENEYLLPAA